MLFAGVVLAAAATPLPAAIDAQADTVFSRARAYVAQRSFPATLSYHIVVTLRSDDGTADTRTYDVAFEGDRNIVHARAISEEENAHPLVPTGVNVVVSLTGSTSTGSTGTAVQINRPADEPDVLGVPMLSPTYAFGIGRETAVSLDDAQPGLRVIASVHADVRDYDATYLGDETVADETYAHLRLSPLRNPERLRIRELWVAPDGAPLRALVRGNFTSKPWDDLDWIVTFRRDARALYIETERTRDSVRIDRFRRGHVSVTFANIRRDDIERQFLLNVEPNVTVREP